MNKKYAIFDMDGTLVDSMVFWKRLGREYLESKGVTGNLDDVMEQIKTMTMTESSQLFIDEFSLEGTAKSVADEMNRMMDEHYNSDIPLKNGVKEYIEKLHQEGVTMCVASATAEHLMESCLSRLGVRNYFDFLLSCEFVGVGKNQPDVYYEAARRLHALPAEIAVYEDALYAAETSKKAGFYTIGVYDDNSKYQWEKLKKIADEYIADWRITCMKTALTIAGSDSSGGAGIQADIKTMIMNGVYAMSAITALTAQNTMGVQGIMEVTPEFLSMQIDSVFEDIRPDAIKIGMVSNSDLIRVIAERLRFYKAENIIVDPVMVATSGSKLMETDAVSTLVKELLPIATLVTPNIPEAEILSGMVIQSKDDMIEAAKAISDAHGCAVLLKGGHSINDANDLLYTDGAYQWFEGKRIDNPNTHGTGCTLSSAIAANLAKGQTLDETVKNAKDYISGALAAMLDLGKGSGPMNHGFNLYFPILS